MTLKRIRVCYKSSLFLALGATLGFALLGNILHDVIVRFVPDEEMTVFPFGTMLSFGGYIFSFIFIGLLGAGTFDKILYMGETRHRFYKDMVLSYLVIFGVILIIPELTYAFEQWKFRTVFPEYPVEAGLNFIHNPAIMIILLISGICFSLLLTALGLRYSIKTIGCIIWVFFIVLGVTIGRFSDAGFFDAAKDSGNIVLASVAVLSLVAFVISYRLIMKQDA